MCVPLTSTKHSSFISHLIRTEQSFADMVEIPLITVHAEMMDYHVFNSVVSGASVSCYLHQGRHAISRSLSDSSINENYTDVMYFMKYLEE